MKKCHCNEPYNIRNPKLYPGKGIYRKCSCGQEYWQEADDDQIKPILWKRQNEIKCKCGRSCQIARVDSSTLEASCIVCCEMFVVKEVKGGYKKE